MSLHNTKKKLLEGVRVLDFSRMLVGSYSSMLLADLGAEVIKVEPPGGDETRGLGPPFRGEDSLYYLSINRNKKSMCLDLKKSESKEIAIKMIAKSDILIENYPSGKMSSFGLDYESVKEYNKKLIYTSVNSFGNKGPLRKSPAFDLIMQSYVGVMNITGGPDTEPFIVGFPVMDIMAGSHTYGAILTGLLHRNFTGEGQYINTSLLESNIFAMPTVVTRYLNGGSIPTRTGNDNPNISPYTVFKLSSGYYFSLGVATDLQTEKLWKVLNLDKEKIILGSYSYSFSDFATNKLRIENRKQLKEIIQTIIYKYEDKDLFEKFTNNGIPFSKINSMKDLFDNNEQIDQLELVKNISTDEYGEIKYIRNPITYSNMKLEDLKSPPKKGQNTKEILSNILKFDNETVDKLYKNKIVF